MSLRKPYVAGTFYPRDPEEIRRFAKTYLNPGASCLEARAVILPHAGYMFSGKTACRVLSQIRIPETAFLIGPNHSGFGAEFALMAEGAWQTPLGNVPIDSHLASAFLKASPHLVNDEIAHEGEHSLEVEVPLLQILRPTIKIVPLIVGTLDLGSAREVALQCASVIAERTDVLLIISTDMSHYESDEATRQKDRHALNAIAALDPDCLVHSVTKYRITMCGFVPVYMLLVMKERLRLHQATLVEYTTSAEASGDYKRVVGYAGFILQ